VKRALLSLAILLSAAVLWAGCNNPASSTPAASSSSDEGWINVTNITHAQPKLPTLKLYMGAEALDAEMALTPREDEVGMMYRTNIQETDAMIFNLGSPTQASFWMKNCPESISAAYISPDGVIQEIHHLEQNDTNPVLSAQNNIQFVLETREGWFQRHNVGVGTLIKPEQGSLTDDLRLR